MPKATPQNVTLYPKQREIVKRIAKTRPGLDNNFSLALRFIIDDWAMTRMNELEKWSQKNTVND